MARRTKRMPASPVVGPALLDAVEAISAAFETLAGLEEEWERLRALIHPGGSDRRDHDACTAHTRFGREVYDPAFAEMERLQDALVAAMAAAGVSAVVYKGRMILPTMGTLCRDWHEFPSQVLFLDPAKVITIAEGGRS